MRRYLMPWFVLLWFGLAGAWNNAPLSVAQESKPPHLVPRAPFPTPAMTAPRTDVRPFRYRDVGGRIPFYPPGKQWGVQGKPRSRMQEPLPAEESLKHIVVPKGFEVRLFVAEPDLRGKPIAMAWDARGRLWVAETRDYPNDRATDGKGNDHLRICEDTDGDGRADRFIQFADRLSIPTAIAFYRGGVIVQNGSETLYLKDTDGDDVADERRVLFSGWNMNDTHGGVSNFQYGLDNWIWATQGYNPSKPSGSGKTYQGFRQGFFRFRPDGSQLEFIRSTNNNTWGLGISEEGIIFGSTANRNPSVHMPIANRYYEGVRGWTPPLVLGSIAQSHLFRPVTDRVRQVDHHGGYTAGAGHALYTARTYPQAYWNRAAFVCGPTGHLVGTFELQPAGSTFRATYRFNLMASDDEWTAPIMAEVGPDGNVWVIDWYNYIVQHNPTPRGFETGPGNAYRSALRDKSHGRIYRIVYRGPDARPAPPVQLDRGDPKTLVDALQHPVMLWRKHAQRLLVERGQPDVVPHLIELVRDQSTDAIGLNVGAIHALWTLHGLHALDGRFPKANRAVWQALHHPSAGVRRNAVLVLPDKKTSTRVLIESGVLDDRSPQVQLAALLTLCRLPTLPQVGPAMVEMLRRPQMREDRWLWEAAVCAAARHDEVFLQACIDVGPAAPAGSGSPSTTASVEQRRQPVLNDKPKTTEPWHRAVRIVAEHLARGNRAAPVVALFGKLDRADNGIAASMVQGFARGWPRRAEKVQLDRAASRVVEHLFPRLAPQQQVALIELVQRWGGRQLDQYLAGLQRDLLQQLDDRNRPPKERIAAAKQLIALQPASAEWVSRLLDRISVQTPPELSAGILRAVQGTTSPSLGTAVVQRWTRWTPAVRRVAIALLLDQPRTVRVLLDAMRRGTVPLSDLTLDQRQRLLQHPDIGVRRAVRRLLAQGGALPDADRQKVLTRLLPLAGQRGDAAAGKEVFLKQCAKCHRHGTEGNAIGPDLTGMAVHSKEELLTQIIDPSRTVEGNYRVYSVATTDGRVLSGLLAAESRTAIELFDVEGKRKVILREQIEALRASSKSLMPDGFEKQLSSRELVDLLEFLTRPGKYLPLDLRPVATIASDRGMFYRPEATAERLIFDSWGTRVFRNIPFFIADPKEGRVPNIILLHGPKGAVSARMPRTVRLAYHGPARKVHLLGGIGGWAFPASRRPTVSLIVRLHYADGSKEDHPLINGRHLADYIRRVDVPESAFAFAVRSRQVRYLAIEPKRHEPLAGIEFIKGVDETAPIVVAVTIERP